MAIRPDGSDEAALRPCAPAGLHAPNGKFRDDGSIRLCRVKLGDGPGGELEVGVRVSDRARRCRIQVGAGGVTLVRPRRMGESTALRLLHDNIAWVVAQIDRANAMHAAVAVPPNTVLLGGSPVPVSMRPSDGRRTRVEENENGLVVHAPRNGGTPPRTALEPWLRARARMAVEASVARHAAQMGVKPAAVQIRAQRTRWGSCSRKGGLSFNWRLVQAPPDVLDYVVVHELAHIVHPNHSQAFWMLVHAHCPAYPSHKRWLRRHAGLLAADPCSV